MVPVTSDNIFLRIRKKCMVCAWKSNLKKKLQIAINSNWLMYRKLFFGKQLFPSQEFKKIIKIEGGPKVTSVDFLGNRCDQEYHKNVSTWSLFADN